LEPLVSIVIPTYNHEKFIGKTIDSIINQSYKQLQIIVADDASQDRTNEIISTYTRNDKRIIHLTTEQNLGIPKNFNRAFDACSGNYVAFLGGDDRMHPEKIERQVAFLEQNPDYDLCFHDMVHWDLEKEQEICLQSDLGAISLNPVDWVFPVDWFFRKKHAGILPSACLARSNYFLHARYNEQFRYKHELLFTLDNYMNKPNGRWAYVDKVLGTYGVHRNNFSMQSENKSVIEEETKLLCKVARERYPTLQKRINEHWQFFIFKHLLFDWVSGEKKSRYIQEFKRGSGKLKYLYLVLLKVYFKKRNKRD
jgi:glycosyltransferase involved in cell wall biosynthesis